MKHCPACKTTYTDDSLSFCLSDGTSLVPEADDDEQTVVRRVDGGAVRVDLPKSDPTVVVRREQPSGSSNWVKFLIAALVVGALAILGLGIAGAAFYYGTAGREPEPIAKTPSPAATATPDTEKERLKDEIANIQRQLEEQKKNANTWEPSDHGDELDSNRIAIVDSPNDGFLALRSLPDADKGERIAKIPDGAEVEILNCKNNAVTIGGRTGHWCEVSYNNMTGWVFDAWLEY